MLDYALRYADLGYSVIPIEPSPRKRPLVKWAEFQERCAGFDEIEKWWTTYSEANIGLVCRHPLIVVDRDKADNPWPGSPEREQDLAAGPMALTPNAGRHYLFRTAVPIQRMIGRIAENVDILGEGGYFVAPPSAFGGRSYQWVPGSELDCGPDDLPLPPLWLVHDLQKASRRTGSAQDEAKTDLALVLSGVEEGARNDAAARLSGKLIADGYDNDAALAFLRTWNAQNKPPMEDAELVKVLRSIAKRHLLTARPEEQHGEIAPDDRQAILDGLSKVFAVTISDVERYSGDDPYYVFTVDGHHCRVPAAKMVSQNAWRAEITAGAKRLPKAVPNVAKKGEDKGHRWDQYANRMMAIAVERDSSETASAAGLFREWIAAYIQTGGNGADDASAVVGPGGIVGKDGAAWFSATELCRLINLRFHAQLSIPRLCQMMTELGIEHKQISVTYETTREHKCWRMWRVPDEHAGDIRWRQSKKGLPLETEASPLEKTPAI